jgi:hypothetical protein
LHNLKSTVKVEVVLQLEGVKLMAELGIESKLQVAFNELGVTKGVPAPEFVAPKGNNDPARYVTLHNMAWQFFVANVLASAADKRKDIAKKACESVGMFEPAKDIAKGSSGVIHQTPDVIITCEKKNPATRLDEATLRVQLATVGRLKPEAIDTIIAASKKENAPATSYKMIWIS